MDLDVTKEDQIFLLLIYRNKNVFPLEFTFYDIILNKINFNLCSKDQPERITIENKTESTSIKFDFRVNLIKKLILLKINFIIILKMKIYQFIKVKQ